MPYDGDPNRWAPTPKQPASKKSVWQTIVRALLWPKLLFDRSLTWNSRSLFLLPGLEFAFHLALAVILFLNFNPFMDQSSTWWMWFVPVIGFSYGLGILMAFFINPPKRKELVPALQP